MPNLRNATSYGKTSGVTCELGAAHPQVTITEPALTAMPAPVRGVVFFSDGAGFGIEMEVTLDALTPGISPERTTRLGSCQQCRQSCSTAKTATSC